MGNKLKIISFIILFYIIFFDYTFPQNNTSLFFREDWKEIPAAIPITQEHVTNSDLLLNLYGSGKDSLKKSHHDQPIDDPFYVWSGLCLGNWAVTLKHKNSVVDLTGLAKIRWRSKQSGFHYLHIILKLADGTWLISKQSDGPSNDWLIKEFNISEIDWFEFNINSMTEADYVKNPKLAKVEEIGFTDLMKGGGSLSCSRLDWIEVYGKSDKKK